MQRTDCELSFPKRWEVEDFLLSFSPPLMLEHSLKVSIPLLIPLPKYLWILSPKFPRYNLFPTCKRGVCLELEERGCFHSASCSGHTLVVVESTSQTWYLAELLSWNEPRFHQYCLSFFFPQWLVHALEAWRVVVVRSCPAAVGNVWSPYCPLPAAALSQKHECSSLESWMVIV